MVGHFEVKAHLLRVLENNVLRRTLMARVWRKCVTLNLEELDDQGVCHALAGENCIQSFGREIG